MKVGVQVLLYNVGAFLPRMLENCGPFVDRIYASYNPKPHSDYNPAAPGMFANRTDLSLIERNRWRDKVTLLRNDCTNEVDQRNLCLRAAQADGMDVLIVQDADEYYHPADYRANIQAMEAARDRDYFAVPWYIFWKTTEYVVEYANGSLVDVSPPYAINCRTGVEFCNKRAVTSANYLVLPGICYHLAYVMSDEDMFEKVNTWSHAADFERASWYEVKWRLWRPETRWLHPVRPRTFHRAVRFPGELPPVLAGFPNPPLRLAPRSAAGLWRSFRYDAKHGLLDVARAVKRTFRH